MKTGRNDPCPCGSGQKYKKCCEAKDEAKRGETLAAENAALTDTLDGDEAAKAQKQGDATARREGFTGRTKQAPAMRPTHVRKRTV